MSTSSRPVRAPGAVLRRFTCVGLILGGAVGAIVGLIVGLRTYAPTAAFAVVEVGVPSAVVCGLIGFAAGACTLGSAAGQRSHQRHRQR